jgi:hypothetical protein
MCLGEQFRQREEKYVAADYADEPIFFESAALICGFL